MRLTVVLLFVSIFSVSAKAYSQATFNIHSHNVTLRQLFDEVERNSDYSFSYRDSEINTSEKVSVDLTDASIERVLNQAFTGKSISYTIRNTNIVLSKKAAPAQQSQRTVKGIVTNTEGEVLPGATITVVGSSRGVITDMDGGYSIAVAAGDQLKFSYLGMSDQVIPVENLTTINVVMESTPDMLEEVTVVAFATQKKESVIASVSTINPSQLKVPSSNLTTTFAGRIAGIIAYQRSGEPGQDNAQFFIRGVTSFGTGKVNPLILIDGMEMSSEDLSRLTTDDIASFSIMKDANATALYGSRGANGVILVTTKEGHEGRARVQFRAEGSFSSPTQNVDIADPVTFMKMQNEAVRTRLPGSVLPYTPKKVNYTERGLDPLYYPAINWQDMLFNQNTFNQRYNLNISGGGKTARYYVAAAYNIDNGILKVDKRQNFNNNININKYSLRANVNVNVTPTTEFIVRLNGAFDDYSGPLEGGTRMFEWAYGANPVLFHPTYAPDEATQFAKHILYGNYGDGSYMNPYAEMLRGYKSENRSTMYVQFEARQQLDFITEGLSARALFNVNRLALLSSKYGHVPYYYGLAEKDPAHPERYQLIPLNPEKGEDYLSPVEDGQSRSVENNMYFESVLQYSREFNEKHAVSGLLVFTLREKKDPGGDLQGSLPFRNVGLAGRFTYAYDSRYFVEANFGYNGSERFSENERWGFFPSIGAGWIVSNEEWWKPLKYTISKLKLKATYGLVGNDEIGDASDRFYYLSRVNMNDGDRGISFGDNWGYSRPGISIDRYEDPLITWEISHKQNYGIELNLFNQLEIQADYFREKRTNILQNRADIPTTMGLQATPKANIGVAKGHGVDLSVDWNKLFDKNLWMVLRGNFTYASSNYEVYEEPAYENAPWRKRVGQPLSQEWGLIAERLFLDDAEVANSPVQGFGEYGPGDIKYKDINKDGKIDDSDNVPIGYPTRPEIIYGFGLSFGFKGFDLSCFFQGSARSSIFISPSAIAPFTSVSGAPGKTNRAVMQHIADSHWTEADRDIYAFWPRLSQDHMSNNEKRSTWWLRDGAFLRFKNVEFGYTLPSRVAESIFMHSLRVYVSGSNLGHISTFRMWDPEQAASPLNYPLQRVFNIGLNIEF